MADNSDARARQAAARAAQQLGHRLLKIRREAAQQRSTGFTVPELTADPPASSDTNLWLLTDGRLRARNFNGTIREYTLTGTPGGPTSSVALPADPVPTRHRTEYPAAWAATYCPVHGVETGRLLPYGRESDVHGNRRILVGFDTVQIRADLAGAVVRRVELTAVNGSSRQRVGVTLHWGAHNAAVQPLDWTAVRRSAYVADWPQTGTGEPWRNVPVWYGVEMQAGRVAGLTVHQPNGSDNYAGTLDWATVRLAVDYTR